MFEFTESSLGNERSWISRKLIKSLLGTRPRGEHTKLSKGGEVNGPAIRFSLISFSNFLFTTSGLDLADWWLRGNGCVVGDFDEGIGKPSSKPLTTESPSGFPIENDLNLFVLIGVGRAAVWLLLLLLVLLLGLLLMLLLLGELMGLVFLVCEAPAVDSGVPSAFAEGA